MGIRRNQKRIKKLCERLQSPLTIKQARKAGDTSSFSRKRTMPLKDIVLCTLAKKGLTTVMEIFHYFKEKGAEHVKVSKQNYLKQRKKLNPDIFKILNSEYLSDFYQDQEAQEEVKRWNDYILLVEDGSCAEIPNSAQNRLQYGQSSNQYGKGVARAHISVLYDKLNHFILDLQIGQLESSEIEQAKASIQALKEIVKEQKVLILFDRNYASIEFMSFLEESGIKYIIRLADGQYKAERDAMPEDDCFVQLQHTKSRMACIRTKKAQRACQIEKQQASAVRITEAVLDNGEETAFISNLKEETGQQIIELYRSRWAIEGSYHTLKNKMKFESVTGKDSVYVKQDFWAHMLVFNMLQDLITESQTELEAKEETKALKYRVKINENIAIALFKERFIRLMLVDEDALRGQMFLTLKGEMESNIVPIRQVAGKERKWNHSNKYKCNLKPAF